MKATRSSTPHAEAAARRAFPDAPLFHAAVLFAGGIVAARWLWLPPGRLLVALALLALLCSLAACKAQRVLWLPMAALWLLLGAWCAEMEPQPAPSPALAALSDNLLRTVEGTVTGAGPLRSEQEVNLRDADSAEEPASAPLQPSQRIDLQVATLETVSDESDAQAPIQGAVRLTVRWPASPSPAQPLRCGEKLRAVVRLLPPEVYHDPGVWNRAGFLLDQGITSAATVSLARVERLGADRGLFLSCRLHSFQHEAASRLLSLPAAMRRWPRWLRLSSEDADLLAAMIAGDRTWLSRSLRVGFERTGSFHMLVVSGFHLAIVAGCVLWTARRLRLARIPATLATILSSFAYALFTGFALPVQRSLWMVTVYLLTRLLFRARSPLNTIGLAALALLSATPRSFFEASFQMTLLAVVSIGGIALPLVRRGVQPLLAATRQLPSSARNVGLPQGLAQFRSVLQLAAAIVSEEEDGGLAAWIAWRAFPALVRFLLRTWELLLVTCVVELAMTLPMAIWFHRITLLALPVNLLLVPLLLALVPAALLTLLALFLWPPLALLPAAFTALLLHGGVGLVRHLGGLSLADVRIPAPLLWQSAAFCALLGLSLWLAHEAGRRRHLAWASLLTAALLALLPRPVQHPPDALLVEAIDVGQGDSILLVTPDGKTLLVDGGGFGGGPRQAPQEFDIGEEVVSEALWARGIRHLDAVALTHAHSDHMGGLPAVLRNFHPQELWVGNNPPVAAYTALLDEAAALHLQVRRFSAGETLRLGAAQIAVLAPVRGYQPGAEPANNDSLVLHVAYGNTSVLLEGDAEAPVEEAMLAGSGLPSTLLKVGHHGSLTSTRPAFLARVHPQWAVISCGLRNRYGHPRSEVLQALQSAGTPTFSTDLQGAVCFRLDGKVAAPENSCVEDR